MNAPVCFVTTIVGDAPRKGPAGFAAAPAKSPAANAIEFLKGMLAAGATCLEKLLAKNQLFSLPDADATLRCLAGQLWLTRDGDIEDYLLNPGQSFAIRRGDRAVVQALQPSRVRLVA